MPCIFYHRRFIFYFVMTLKSLNRKYVRFDLNLNTICNVQKVICSHLLIKLKQFCPIFQNQKDVASQDSRKKYYSNHHTQSVTCPLKDHTEELLMH